MLFLKEIIKEMISGDEKRVSSMIIIALILTVTLVYMTIKKGDSPSNLVGITTTSYLLVVGGNIAPQVINKIARKERR